MTRIRRAPQDPYAAAETAKEQAATLLDALLATAQQLHETVKLHNQLATERHRTNDAGKRPAYLSASRVLRAAARERNLPPTIADAIASAAFYAAPPEARAVKTPARAKRQWEPISKKNRIQEHRGQLLRNTTTQRTWLLRVYGGVHDGRRTYHNETIQGSQLEAERCLTELLTATASRAKRPIDTYTVAEYARSIYLPDVRERLDARVCRKYANDIEDRLLPNVGDRLMRTITKRSLAQLKQSFVRAGAAESTAETTVATLRRILRHASARGMRTPALLPHETQQA